VPERSSSLAWIKDIPSLGRQRGGGCARIGERKHGRRTLDRPGLKTLLARLDSHTLRDLAAIRRVVLLLGGSLAACAVLDGDLRLGDVDHFETRFGLRLNNKGTPRSFVGIEAAARCASRSRNAFGCGSAFAIGREFAVRHDEDRATGAPGLRSRYWRHAEVQPHRNTDRGPV
jgi:hypothetical protein